MKKNRVSQDPILVFKGRQIGKAFLSIPTDELIARKERLEEALTSSEPFRQRRMTRNGPVWETWTRQQIIEAIKTHDAAIELLKAQDLQDAKQDAEQDKLVNEGHLIKAQGEAAWRFLEMQAKANILDRNLDALKAGNALKKPRKESCPKDYFRPVTNRIVAYLDSYHSDKYQNGKWIGSDKSKSIVRELFFILRGEFAIQDFPGKSLAEEFKACTGIEIVPRTFNDIKRDQVLNVLFARDIKYYRQKHKNF